MDKSLVPLLPRPVATTGRERTVSETLVDPITISSAHVPLPNGSLASPENTYRHIVKVKPHNNRKLHLIFENSGRHGRARMTIRGGLGSGRQARVQALFRLPRLCCRTLNCATGEAGSAWDCLGSVAGMV